MPVLQDEIIYNLLHVMHGIEKLDDSLLYVIREIGLLFDVEAAEAWLVHYSGEDLGVRARWINDAIEAKAACDLPEKLQLGTGLPGLVLERQTTQFTQNLTASEYAGCKDRFPADKELSAVAFPVEVDEKMVAVFVLYRPDPFPDTEEIHQLFRKISLQAGIDIQRKQATHQMNSFFNGSPDLLGIMTEEGRFIKVNPSFCKLLNYSEEELTSGPFSEFIHPDDVDDAAQTFESIKNGLKNISTQLRVRTREGIWKWIVWHPSEWIVEEGVIYTIGRDVTAMKQTRLDLLKFKNVIEMSNDGIAIYTLEDRQWYVNEAIVDMVGYRSEEVTRLGGIFELYTDKNLKDIIPRMLFSGNYWQGDIALNTRDGKTVDLYLSAGPVFNNLNELIAVYAIHTDISEHRQAQQKIRESLREKEMLLSEIHHRVQNNLAVVSSMLQLQALQEDQQVVNEKLLESSLRIKTIASIHEHLYQSDSFSKIDFKKNIAAQIAGIVETIASESDITVSFDCIDLDLNINQAITTSLIVNEVVTNIVKHAFRDREEGHIHVSLGKEGDRVMLEIRDNGQGVPGKEQLENSFEQSLGLHMINLLSKQLEATYRYTSGRENSFSLTFDKTDKKKGIGSADLF
ncbi:PAS domain S-box protein [Balneolales bacterium ANBcel1]|nr:PAS domain S-box protein [Balneolales bacterium ANBcel1]